MNPLKSLLLAISIISGSAGASAAQVIIGVQPKAQEQGNGLNVQRDYNALLQEIFAPITDELNLTNEQKLKDRGHCHRHDTESRSFIRSA